MEYELDYKYLGIFFFPSTTYFVWNLPDLDPI